MSRLSDTFRSLPAIKARQAIPRHKRRSQVQKTVVGGLIFAVGLLAPKYLGFPWQAGAVIATFGGFTASQQLVKDFLAAVAQLVQVLAGKKPGD